MKYAYAMMIVLCLLASTSWSASNPLIRNCHQAGGEFVVVNSKVGKINDQWALCKFDNSYVGAFDVMAFNNQEGFAQSFNEYSSGATECTGEIITVNFVNSDQGLFVCKYSDMSMIDLGSLLLGVKSQENSKLNKYLGL